MGIRNQPSKPAYAGVMHGLTTVDDLGAGGDMNDANNEANQPRRFIGSTPRTPGAGEVRAGGLSVRSRLASHRLDDLFQILRSSAIILFVTGLTNILLMNYLGIWMLFVG